MAVTYIDRCCRLWNLVFPDWIMLNRTKILYCLTTDGTGSLIGYLNTWPRRDCSATMLWIVQSANSNLIRVYILSSGQNTWIHWSLPAFLEPFVEFTKSDEIALPKFDFSCRVSRSENADYKGSGYDRGHMAAAGNHKVEQKHIEQTFFLSNMAPQVGVGFNRDSWNRLEIHVRKLTNIYKNVYVCTGPLYLPKYIHPSYCSEYSLHKFPIFCQVAVQFCARMTLWFNRAISCHAIFMH